MPEEAREILRGGIVKYSNRFSTNYFEDGKTIARLLSIMAERLNADTPHHPQTEVKEGERLQLFTGFFDPIRVNKHVRYVLPWAVSRPIISYKKRNRMQVPVLASIGYGAGNLEWTLLKRKKVSKVLGLEFNPGPVDERNLEEHLAALDPSLSQGNKPNEFLHSPEALRYFLEGEIAHYFNRAGYWIPSSMVEQFYSYIHDMIDAPSPHDPTKKADLATMVRAYKIRMDAISGAARDHPLFEKAVVSSGEDNRHQALEEIAARSRAADIVLFKDSLHHSAAPWSYIESAYAALREGSCLVVIEPFLFGCSAGENLMRVAFETTFHPESLLDVGSHELWINLLLLCGATIETGTVHSGSTDYTVNYDPFHRFDICLRKQRPMPANMFSDLFASENSDDRIRDMNKNFQDVTEQVDCELEELTLKQHPATFGGVHYMCGYRSLIRNRLVLRYAAQRYGLEEQPYVQLLGLSSKPVRTIISEH